MGLETRGQTEEIKAVSDKDGQISSPATNEAQGNWDTIDGVIHSTDGTAEEPLPSNAVPQGATVLVHPLPGNSDVVNVGPEGVVSYPLAAAGDSYTAQVVDTAEIYVQTPTAGDGVAVHWEADQ